MGLVFILIGMLHAAQVANRVVVLVAVRDHTVPAQKDAAEVAIIPRKPVHGAVAAGTHALFGVQCRVKLVCGQHDASFVGIVDLYVVARVIVDLGVPNKHFPITTTIPVVFPAIAKCPAFANTLRVAGLAQRHKVVVVLCLH